MNRPKTMLGCKLAEKADAVGSWQRLADIVGVQPRTLLRVSAGKEPKGTTLDKIASTLDVVPWVVSKWHHETATGRVFNHAGNGGRARALRLSALERAKVARLGGLSRPAHAAGGRYVSDSRQMALSEAR